MLINLITNASDAMWNTQVKDPIIEIRAAILNGTAPARVRVTVADRGPGVPVDIRDFVFDPFFTTKGVGEGTGLGLWISHEIVSQMGGDLSLDSGGEPGASFRIDLPIADEEE